MAINDSCKIPGDACSKPGGVIRRSMCAAHYYRWKRHGDPLAGGTSRTGQTKKTMDAAIASDTDECIIWPYSTGDFGHGHFYLDGQRYYAHRYVLEQVKGPPPQPGMHAAHAPIICHNPSCINPRHLRWATPAENMDDREIDGTQVRGEKQGSSVLTAHDVRSIRADDGTCVAVGRQYGISPSHVHRIRSRKVWKHID